MKVEIKNKTRKFTPVTMEITFETQDEARSLYERLNLSAHDIESISSLNIHNEDNLNLELFKAVKGVLNENYK